MTLEASRESRLFVIIMNAWKLLMEFHQQRTLHPTLELPTLRSRVWVTLGRSMIDYASRT